MTTSAAQPSSTSDQSAWDQRYSAGDLVWSAEPNVWVAEVAAGLPPGRALDFAAGEGRNAIWLVEQGWCATAVDFSEVGLERARRIAVQRLIEGADDLTTVAADVLEYLPEPRSFDLVVVAYLQLPPTHRTRALKAAAVGVAPGGLLLVVAHDSSNLTEGFGGPRNPEVLYSPADVVEDLRDTDLEIVRAETLVRPVETADGRAFALDAFVTARRPSI